MMMVQKLVTKMLRFLFLKGLRIHNLIVMYKTIVSLKLTPCKQQINHTMQFCYGNKSIFMLIKVQILTQWIISTYILVLLHIMCHIESRSI
jgi:hypothetical protein